MKTIALILATSLCTAAGAHAQQIAVNVTGAAGAPASAPQVPWEPRFSGDMPAAGADAPDDAAIADGERSESGPPTSIVPAAYVSGGSYSSSPR